MDSSQDESRRLAQIIVEYNVRGILEIQRKALAQCQQIRKISMLYSAGLVSGCHY
jgi:hypothetical protein